MALRLGSGENVRHAELQAKGAKLRADAPLIALAMPSSSSSSDDAPPKRKVINFRDKEKEESHMRQQKVVGAQDVPGTGSPRRCAGQPLREDLVRKVPQRMNAN